MTRLPDQFTGLVGIWQDGGVLIGRYRNGVCLEGMSLTPLELLEYSKVVRELIRRGLDDGLIGAPACAVADQLDVLDVAEAASLGDSD